MLHALHRVLKPGGMLIVEDYSREGPLVRHFAWAISWYDPLHQRAYTLADMARLLAVAGLDRTYGARLRIDTLWWGWIVTSVRPSPPRPERESAEGLVARPAAHPYPRHARALTATSPAAPARPARAPR